MDHVQVICTSFQTITTSAPHHSVFLRAGCSSCLPTNSVKALKSLKFIEKHIGKKLKLHQTIGTFNRKFIKNCTVSLYLWNYHVCLFIWHLSIYLVLLLSLLTCWWEKIKYINCMSITLYTICNIPSLDLSSQVFESMQMGQYTSIGYLLPSNIKRKPTLVVNEWWQLCF